MMDTWVMAGKTLLPLPEKWHGLQDIDERYRKRYLDFLMDEDLRSLILKKSKFWESARKFLNDNDFVEVETPTLEVTTGGAEANPFKTHHDDYDLDVFLRISVGELWQKRLMAGGFPRTFEIGRVYRNEGSSPDHTQEFTNLEFYASFMDYTEGIHFTEELIKYIAKETFGTFNFSTRGHSFSLEGAWPKLSYVDAVKEKTALLEARKMGIPIIGICDSNSDPELVDYVIPGNDDARRSIELYCQLVSDAVLQGIQQQLTKAGVDLGTSVEVPAIEN
jgi:lysyl-tRNA synthetase class 2